METVVRYFAHVQNKLQEVLDKLVKEGIEPPIFKSSNVDGGDEHNHAMFEKYYGYWK